MHISGGSRWGKPTAWLAWGMSAMMDTGMGGDDVPGIPMGGINGLKVGWEWYLRISFGELVWKNSG